MVDGQLLAYTIAPSASQFELVFTTVTTKTTQQFWSSGVSLEQAQLEEASDTELSDLEYFQQMLSNLLNGYFTLFSVFSGILLNFLCIYVFVKFHRSVIQYYLVTLTCWQTALLANAFLLYCLPTLLFGHVVSNGTYVLLYPYVYAFANTTHTGSVWIILTLTVDRYLALCRPLTHRAIGKKSRVKKLMIAVSLLAVLFSAPRFFEVTTVWYCPSMENGTICNSACEPTVARTALPEDKIYWTVYHIILAMLFVTLGPCLLLFGLTLRISLALRRSILRRRALCAPNSELDGRNKKETCSKKEHKANVMLMLVIAKFLISDILPTVADVLEHLVGNEVFMSSNLATLFVDFSNFLVVLNCSTNFWVFLLWGKRFRRCCMYLFAGSTFGRAFKWMKIFADSDFSSYLGHPRSSFTTNYTKSRSRCSGYYSGEFGRANSSLVGMDSATAATFLIAPTREPLDMGRGNGFVNSRARNGIHHGPFHANHRKYSAYPGIQVPRGQRSCSYAGVDISGMT
ncbi:7 transmembrane receptor (rhodopsin family) domain-containing protein [Ditylenchus destructor]|nr:7 transmembrane receptor (rhodopsin family) domain-containing protein [Ditylenchus destructor]